MSVVANFRALMKPLIEPSEKTRSLAASTILARLFAKERKLGETQHAFEADAHRLLKTIVLVQLRLHARQEGLDFVAVDVATKCTKCEVAEEGLFEFGKRACFDMRVE